MKPSEPTAQLSRERVTRSHALPEKQNSSSPRSALHRRVLEAARSSPTVTLLFPIWKRRNTSGWPAKAALKKGCQSPISPNLTQFHPISPRPDTPKLAQQARQGEARRAHRDSNGPAWGKGRASKGGRGWRDACVSELGGSCVRCGALGVNGNAYAASSSSIPTKASRVSLPLVARQHFTTPSSTLHAVLLRYSCHRR